MSQIYFWNKTTCFGQFLCPSSGVFHCTHSKPVWQFYSKYKFEKLVHLVDFIIRIYHDARSSERQKLLLLLVVVVVLLLLLLLLLLTVAGLSCWQALLIYQLNLM
jgi:hypothetical protein